MKAGLYDISKLISKLSLTKIANIAITYLSFQFSKTFKKNWLLAFPFGISIEPTTSCNLSCPECPSGQKIFTRPTGNIDSKFYRSLIDQLSKKVLFLNFYFQGEPYIHRDFISMISYAVERKLYTIASSNGHFFDDDTARKTVESGLDRLIISLDGTTQDTYSAYRQNGDIKKVIEGTKKIIYWKQKLKKRTPFVIFQFLVVKPNEHQVEDVKALGRELGVNAVKFKSAQIYDYKKGSPLIPENEKYSRYKKMPDGSYSIKSKLNNYCWKMWHSSVITWDGKVIPCCFDKDADYVFGDLKETPFTEIWKNKKYTAFRMQLSKSRKSIEICKNCTEGSRVWV